VSDLYPPQPEGVPADLTAPSSAYRRSVWSAGIGLLVFVGLYLALALYAAFVDAAFLASALWGWSPLSAIAHAVPATLVVVVLVKGLLGVRRGGGDGLQELKADEAPELFAFVYRIADEARAPRPHKIFVSTSVNAAVFYDLSVWSLLLPTRKNLLIGLGLVNALTLDEFKAVLAHEFGHFAQRSMRVGTWVYVARQVISDLVARRDRLDRLLSHASYFDMRFAWIAWILRLIVWSIRSVFDSGFRLLVLLERALSREMEFQADLVAVSLTGSDSLIHALHRLSAADEALGRAYDIAIAQAQQEAAPGDLFAVQQRVLERRRELLHDPSLGVPPPLPALDRASHRLFDEGAADVPRMWSTHPPNADREANAKRRYVASNFDERSPWLLFANARAVRVAATRHWLLRALPELVLGEPATPDADAAMVDRLFAHPRMDGRYRGLYLDDVLLRYGRRADDLIGELPSADTLDAALDACHPDAIIDEIAVRDHLAKELATLEALGEGRLEVRGAALRSRGKELSRADLPDEIALVASELAAAQAVLNERFRRARGAHLAAARALGRGWEEHLRGFLALAHYAEHCAAELYDADGYLAHSVQLAIADGNVSSKEASRLVRDGAQVADVVASVMNRRAEVLVGASLHAVYGDAGWPGVLPDELKLFPPVASQLGPWLNAKDTWVRVVGGALRSLRNHALDALVRAEAQVARMHRSGDTPEPAPSAASVPDVFPVRMPGQERPRLLTLSPWERFVTADGVGWGAARAAVAASVLVPFVMLPWWSARIAVTAVNGLGIPVVVHVGGSEQVLAPGEHAAMATFPGRFALSAATTSGEQVDAIEYAAWLPGERLVYNVAQASELVETVVLYGGGRDVPPRLLQNPHVLVATEDYVLTDPPESLSSDHPVTRSVLRAVPLPDVVDGSEQVDPAGFEAHAAWDPLNDRLSAVAWRRLPPEHALRAADAWQQRSGVSVAVERRVQDALAPDALAARCATYPTLFGGGDLRYLSLRCRQGTLPASAWRAALADFPDHPWLRYGAIATGFGEGELVADEADVIDLLRGERLSPVEKGYVCDLMVRAQRLAGRDGADVPSAALLQAFPELAQRMAAPSDPSGAVSEAFGALQRGALANALSGSFPPGYAAALVVLVGASDGSTQEMIDDAVGLANVERLGPFEHAARAGLLARAGRQEEAIGLLTRQGLGQELARAVVSGEVARVDELLATAHLYERAAALAAARTRLGSAAPQAWDALLERLLFPWERPYFAPRSTPPG